MHDPYSAEFVVKYPWWTYTPWPKKIRDKVTSGSWDYKYAASQLPKNKKYSLYSPEGYKDPFITIWHRDPEKNGCDDSCRRARRALSSKQMSGLKALARNEAEEKYFLRFNNADFPETESRVLAESLYRGLILTICNYASVEMSYAEAAKRAALAIHTPDCCDSGARIFCFVPGYHTNFNEDDNKYREEYFYNTCKNMLSWIIEERQPWYNHPRWHIWHWKLQIHPWQLFVGRWFDRCEKCRRKFKKNESVMSTCWDTPEKTWKEFLMFWRGNKHIQCEKCNNTVYIVQDSK